MFTCATHFVVWDWYRSAEGQQILSTILNRNTQRRKVFGEHFSIKITNCNILLTTLKNSLPERGYLVGEKVNLYRAWNLPP